VEDVRDALAGISAGLSEASARQYVLRIKSLLGYAHALGYTPFNAGATIKIRSNAGNRGATLAKRIISEVEVSLLIRAAPSKRDRVLLEVIYAGGLRVSETVALTWADVVLRGERGAAVHYRQGRQGAPGAAARDRQPLSAIAAWRRERRRPSLPQP
jgi:site-specific recombinase XerD